MNKLKILSLLPALILCSCGKTSKNKYVGTYQFRLGKSDGNHMEVTAVITDDNDPKAEGYKVMNLTADLGDQLDPTSRLDEIEDLLDDIAPFLKPFIEEELIDKIPGFVNAVREEMKDLKEIKFFYKVTDHKNAKYGSRIELGTHALADILNSIKTKHPDLTDIIDEGINLLKGTKLFRDDMFIMPDKAKYVFNAFIGKKGLTFQVPISVNDLDQQLIWYGFEQTISATVALPENYIVRMPGTKGEDRFGIHPGKEVKNNKVIKDEVKEVNKEFAYEFSNSPLYEKDDFEDETETARFVLESENGTKKLYLKFNGEFDAKIYDGYVGIASRKAISLNVDADGLCAVTSNGKTGLKEGFLDEKGTEFKFSEVVSDPFEFRDFNTVNVGLAKVVE